VHRPRKTRYGVVRATSAATRGRCRDPPGANRPLVRSLWWGRPEWGRHLLPAGVILNSGTAPRQIQATARVGTGVAINKSKLIHLFQ
jgi:hypothetical protein